MELGHDALDQGDGNAVVIENLPLGFGVLRAERLAPGLPPVHEMIGREGVKE